MIDHLLFPPIGESTFHDCKTVENMPIAHLEDKCPERLLCQLIHGFVVPRLTEKPNQFFALIPEFQSGKSRHDPMQFFQHCVDCCSVNHPSFE